MGPRFVNIDHDTPLLLPPNLRDWVPSDPLSHFILDAVDQSVSARMIAGDSHPDHDTLCAFRRNNLALINESFVRVLEMAAELKILKVGQITVAIDGTKVVANASKHSAVSYQRSGELIQQLEWTLVSMAYNLKRLHRMVGTA